MNKNEINKIVDNIVIDIPDVNGDGKYNIIDFLSLSNNEILQLNNGKKFDICFINPAFKQKASKYLKFIKNNINISNKIISALQIMWLKKHRINAPSTANFRKDLSKYVNSLEELSWKEVADAYKSNVIFGDAGIFVFSENNKNHIDLEKYGFSDGELSLYKKLSIKNKDNIIAYGNCLKASKSLKDIKEKYFVPVYQWHIGNNCYNTTIMDLDTAKDYKRDIKYLIFNSENEVNNFKKSLKTKFMQYYFHNFIVPDNCKLLIRMFLLKDYSKPVTDETFYKIFNLSKDEIKIIEEFNPSK